MALNQIFGRETCEEREEGDFLVSWTVLERKGTVEHLQLHRLGNTEIHYNRMLAPGLSQRTIMYLQIHGETQPR